MSRLSDFITCSTCFKIQCCGCISQIFTDTRVISGNVGDVYLLKQIKISGLEHDRKLKYSMYTYWTHICTIFEHCQVLVILENVVEIIIL